MAKIVVNIVRWKEGDKDIFQHTGSTFELEEEDLGLVKERTNEIPIDSKHPLVISEREYITNDGRTVRNISMHHQLIGLMSDYYIYNESP